ncbi:MAG TPA: peptidylprolyl isomerase, partial [Sediminibacterium sp.]|nr:peptidylprolyl isomerase [Sediminibacterium sp.]
FSYVYVPYMSVADSLAKVSDAEIADYVKSHANEFRKEEETRNVSYITFSAAPSSNDSAEVLKQIADLKAGFAETHDEEAYLSKVGSEVPFYNSYFSKSRLQQANKDTLVKIPVGQVYGPYIDGGNYILAKMVGQRQWPDSAKVRHILIATSDPRSGQMIRPDSIGKKLIDSIQTAIKNGANFDSLCLKYSDDPGSKEKGGVYDYFPQGNMVIPFNDFAFDNPVGTKGVVKTDYGYHYVEVLGHKGMGTAYKIAYLAKSVRASQETDNLASNAAAQFAVSCKNAQQFNTGAEKIHKQILSANDIKQNDYMMPGIGQSRTLVRWVYEHNVGDISDPVSIGDQYIVAIISAVNPAGLVSVAEARPIVETILRNKKKAAKIIQTQFKGNSLQAYATSSGAPVRQADSLSFAAPFISGVGSEPKIVGAGFNKSLLNKTSTPIAGETGVFAIQVNSIGAKASASDPETVKQGMLQSVKMLSYRGLDALRKAADIKDYRSKFF